MSRGRAEGTGQPEGSGIEQKRGADDTSKLQGTTKSKSSVIEPADAAGGRVDVLDPCGSVSMVDGPGEPMDYTRKAPTWAKGPPTD